MGFHCGIPGDIVVSIRKEGGETTFESCNFQWGGRISISGMRMANGVIPKVFHLSIANLFEIRIFVEQSGQLAGKLPLAYFRFKP